MNNCLSFFSNFFNCGACCFSRSRSFISLEQCNHIPTEVHFESTKMFIIIPPQWQFYAYEKIDDCTIKISLRSFQYLYVQVIAKYEPGLCIISINGWLPNQVYESIHRLQEIYRIHVQIHDINRV